MQPDTESLKKRLSADVTDMLIRLFSIGVPGFKNDETAIKKPDRAVADRLLVSRQVYASWNAAAE